MSIRKTLVLSALLLPLGLSIAEAQVSLRSAGFVRGDTDGDGSVDFTDAIRTLEWKFLGAFTPMCLDAVDANDSGSADFDDAITTLEFLFLSLGMPPSPGPFHCGPDPTESDDLDCVLYSPCSCVAVEDLNAVLSALVSGLCAPAPILEQNLGLGDLTICPSASGNCPDSTDGCAIAIDNVTLSLDSATSRARVDLDTIMSNVPVNFDPLFGRDTNCQLGLSTHVTGTATLDAAETSLGLLEFRNLGDIAVSTDGLNVEPDGCGLIGNLFESLAGLLQDEIDTLIADAIGGQTDDLVAAVNQLLGGANLCP